MMTYWRNSIADSDRMDVADSRLKDALHIETSITTDGLSKSETGYLFEKFNKMKAAKDTGKTAGQPKLTEIQILISPLSITTTQPVKHAERTYPGIQSPKHPLWIPATLSKSGTLTPSETLSPWISRNVMEPLPPTSNQMAMPPIIGEIRDLDRFLTENKKKSGDWKSYINYCNEMFEAVTGQKPDNYTAEKITVEHQLTVLPDEAAVSVNIGILAVYDYLNRQDVMPPLLTRYATVESPEPRPLLNETGYIQQSARHIGQMGDQHPLSPSQREALYHYQQLGRGEILAINGPPGTGKTMLLQNIVATTLVDSAVNGDKPPVIAISSTNNQAIDNVTESFGKAATKPGKLAGRWLPDITSYALFLPATTKKIPPGTHYAKFKGEGLPNSIETPEYRSRARTSFLKKCGDYAEKPFVNINDAVRFLRDKLIEIVSEIEKSSQLVTDYQQKKATLEIYREMGGIEQYGKQLEQKLFEGIEIIGRLEKLRDDWLHETRSRFWFSRLLVQLGFKSAIAKQGARNRLILSRSPVPTDHLDETSDEAIENFIAQTINRYREESKILREKHGQLQKKNQVFEEARKNWQDWQESQQIVAEPPELSELYKKLDTTLRHQAFQLAVHYWEGRWLRDVKGFLEDPKGKSRQKMEAKWHRYAMLTPCFVSTFFMLPKFFTYSSRDEEDKNWINAPLLSFIDLLIVDESGQTLVETGGASFALAKKAVVVGDIYQIQPVRKITSRVDAGNIKRYLLKPGEPEKEQRKKFQESGLTTYKGSVMKAAQNASPFQLPQIPERGMFLAEHRRCYDSIIDYCNRLTYRGKLDPLRGNPGPGEALFPPMGYANISSRSERANGSRKNSTEAIAIAGWLKDQEDKIRERYDAVEEAVGIITPFVAQKYEIQKALKEQGFKPARMKFGTVHSLQGAERRPVDDGILGPGGKDFYACTDWEDFTTEGCTVYRGHGDHIDMLNAPNMKKNMTLLKRILDKVNQ